MNTWKDYTFTLLTKDVYFDIFIIKLHHSQFELLLVLQLSRGEICVANLKAPLRKVMVSLGS